MVRYGKAISAVVAAVSPKNATSRSDIDIAIDMTKRPSQKPA
jgi:hypothetical protein